MSQTLPPEDQNGEPGPAERRVRDALTDALGRAVRGEVAPPEPRAVRAERAEPEAPAVSTARPISFNAAMARALIAGNKTQTRRPIRPLPAGQTTVQGKPWPADARGEPLACGLAAPGERLWVREPWAYATDAGPAPRAGTKARYEYEADLGPAAAQQRKWRPGRFLARDASRLTLIVSGITAERVRAITPHDAAAEGMPPGLFNDAADAAVMWFGRLWDSIYAGTEFAWEGDPWVWVVRFRLKKGKTNGKTRAHG